MGDCKSNLSIAPCCGVLNAWAKRLCGKYSAQSSKKVVILVNL